MIGADPEFNILFEDKTISADKLMNTLYRKNRKHDNNDMGYKIENFGSIGWDGRNSTGEIRPRPANTPEQICKNLKGLISSFSDKTKLFKLMTTSHAAPIGGHIHFQVDYKLTQHPNLIDNIHKRLISFYLPVQMGEEIIDVRSRTNNNYGKFTDYRVAAVAGQNNQNKDLTQEEIAKLVYTYEFRVPSAEWMTTERIAKATIAYLATIWYEILYKPDNFAKSKELLFNTKKQSLALQEMAMTQYKLITTLILGKIKKHVKNFEYYKEYKEEIDFILSPSKVLDEKKRTEFDIMQGWKIDKVKKPTKRMLLSETKIRSEAKKINIEDLIALITIPYNPDFNVEQFATALKTRIIAINWKLNNKYFLFGLRKGIPGYIVTDHAKNFLYGKEYIKTKLDNNEIQKTFNNMIGRNHNSTNYRRISTENMAKTIYIGIPYEDRTDVKIKKLINLIYEIENKKIKHENIELATLYDDRNINIDNINAKDLEKLGKIYQIYNEEKIKSVIDEGVVEDARNRINYVEEDRRREDLEQTNEQTADQMTDEILRNTLSLTHRNKGQIIMPAAPPQHINNVRSSNSKDNTYEENVEAFEKTLTKPFLIN